MRNMRRMIGPALLCAVVLAYSSFVVAQQAERARTAPAEASVKKAPSGKRFTPEQMENLDHRLATVNSILQRFSNEADAQGDLNIWRRATSERLYGLSLAALQQVERSAHSLDALSGAIGAAAEDPNLIGDPSADLVYTPIAPCRYIDTRVGPIVSPAAPRAYDLFNNGSSYGGSASCALIENVTAAIAANVTITEPAGAPAFLAVKPTLAAPTTSWMNWYEAGPSVQLANAGVFTVDQSGAGTEFFIVVSSPTHVIVDFFGFFAEPNATAVDQIIMLNSEAVAASTSFSIFSPVCPATYRLVGGGHRSSSFGSPATFAASRPASGNSTAVVSGANAGTQWLCQGQTGAAAITFECYAMCARIPGR